MTIAASDIKLLASERMTDAADGGGRRTASVIPDGIAGNIMPKVSRLDSVYGRVNLRKVYGAVQTSNLDTYAGAHAAVMDAPDSDRIHVNIFSTASEFDDRTDARDRIESYVIAGPESRMILYGRQPSAQQAIAIYQRVEEPLPEVGEVLCLSTELTGDIITNQQYVRVTSIAHEIRTFEDQQGEFQRRVITLNLSTPLRYDFKGVEIVSRSSDPTRDTRVRHTTIADAARYFGIKPVALAAAADDLTIKVTSIYSPLVPSTERETPLSNGVIGGAAETLTAGVQTANFTFPDQSLAFDTATIRVPTAISPGTLALSTTAIGVSNGVWSWTDDGLGNLTTTSTGLKLTVDYETGVINFTKPITLYTNWRFITTYTPAVEVQQSAHTKSIDVKITNRGTVYAVTLAPLPSKGTLIVDFRALGKWYRLRDDGTGVLVGDDAAYGTGTVNYITGAVVVTLGSLPDVGSRVMLAWGSPAHYEIAAGGTSDAGATVKQHIELTDLPVKESSTVVSYVSNGVTYTATETSVGVLTGGGLTGTVNHAKGIIEIEYTTRLPDAATNVHVAYTQEVPSTGSPSSISGTVTVTDLSSIDIGVSPIAAKGLVLDLKVQTTVSGQTATARCGLDASGNLVYIGDAIPVSTNVSMVIDRGTVMGTVDTDTGIADCSGTFAVKFTYYDYLGGWHVITDTKSAVLGQWAYSVTTEAPVNDNATSYDANPLTTSPLYVDLTRTKVSTVVPGSLYFKLAGRVYFERNGTLYTDPQIDGTGTEAGTVDFALGEASLTLWTPNTALGLTVSGCLLQWGNWVAWEASFRTAGSPLRSESLTIQVTGEDGTLLTASGDGDGNLTGTHARGGVNYEMGTVFIQWGDMVVAAGNELEQWYDPANVIGSNVWKPMRVQPSTLRYDAVVLSNLPLNADILGLDPVRLPSDGRVPIFRPADVVVIHNTKTYVVANPAVAGTTYDVDRTNLSDLWLVDSSNVRVDTTKYTVDLAAGTFTMGDPLDLAAYAQPLKAKHRIEELNLLSDVQINGELTLTSQLSRDFDTDTLVSSALLFGDMFARVTNVFDQVTWTNVWQDTRIGSNATAEYDTINHPIEVVNASAATERWRINFLNNSAFQVIGENLGVIATGTTAADCAPVNSLTGDAYFMLRAAGWGAGWSVGNNLRFNTTGPTAPIWIARTVLAGATRAGDSFDIQIRGDVDT